MTIEWKLSIMEKIKRKMLGQASLGLSTLFSKASTQASVVWKAPWHHSNRRDEQDRRVCLCQVYSRQGRWTVDMTCGMGRAKEEVGCCSPLGHPVGGGFILIILRLLCMQCAWVKE